MAEKKKTKWVVKKRELECVGIQHRVTLSTRRFLKARVESKKMLIEFKREPSNPHDENAISVFAGSDKGNPYKGMQLGYLPREVAKVLAPAIDKGRTEFGPSFMVGVNVEKGTADLQVKLRIKRVVKSRA
jgi:hypothetical protein